MVKISIDGRQIEAKKGASLLQICLDNGIQIPNLCFLKGMDEPTGSCRLCFVEIEGAEKLLPSCKTRVAQGMVVRTDTPSVRQIQKVVFELLFSDHYMACKNCLVKKTCQLQKIAKLLGVRLKASKGAQASRCDIAARLYHPGLELIPSKCILCQKCIYVCKERNAQPVLTLVKNGTEPTIGFAGDPDGAHLCRECRACVEVCPVSAIIPRDEKAPSGTALAESPERVE
ncbi:MAG: 2Fe-2S iron-sulfur cluster-binding protein [Syntrophobacteraceae bacterium]